MGLFDIFKKKPKVAPVVVEVLYPANWDAATQSVIVPNDIEATKDSEFVHLTPDAAGETFADETEVVADTTMENSDGEGEQAYAGTDADDVPSEQFAATLEEPQADVIESGEADTTEVAVEDNAAETAPVAAEEVVETATPEPVVEQAEAQTPVVETPVEVPVVDAPVQEELVEEATAEPVAEVVTEAVVEEAGVEEASAEPTEQERYDVGLEKTRKSFGERLNAFFAKFRSVDEDFFEDLEDTLIQADVGYETAMQIADELRSEVKLKNAKNKNDIKQVIIDKLISIYDAAGNGEDISMHFAKEGPTVIMFVGVNGVGKTTTIGKMAALYKSQGKKVLLAAADTFRAGATQQLQEWGRRDGVEVVAGPDRADPASVVFDGVQTAIRGNYDVLFVDTAGRLQNNVNLMQELEKMKRIITREIPDAPHEVLIVLDGTTGQNALQQAKLFKDSTDVSGIVLTKLDGTAKGGIVLAIRNEMHLPVKWVGLGEQAADLRPFSPADFVQGLFKGLVD
ncbi:signal recognition particle-docking protein FtsY [Periweissella cryptocerci]|uniref:Signal recognition particle receptor FtsY n=1 Tax=Periweissella cryptocerci TaxID=2506420 RepID=A0A4P6YW30_9LACO|nr:signal recognition particle-docking protein FtsY [Periweissella cryptocerci]QBO37034.1 signal recognition particle-docking protein FtsY [Periweissella cryptocerci]